MKKLLILASLVAFVGMLAQCAKTDPDRRNATTVGKSGWIFEGWACAPDSAKALEGKSPAHYCAKVEKKDKDYLYMKFSARASQKAIQMNSIGMKQTTCREAARLQVAADGLAKILGEYLEKASGVSDGQSTGVAIIAQTKGIMKGVGIYDCCSIDEKTGRCAEIGQKENWVECQCVGYMKFPGGQDGLVAQAKRVTAGN